MYKSSFLDIKNLIDPGWNGMTYTLHFPPVVDENGDIRQFYNGTDDGSISILRTHINSFLKNLNKESV